MTKNENENYIHEYHFKINQDIQNRLINIAERRNIALSTLICEIIKKTAFKIDWVRFALNRDNRRYHVVDSRIIQHVYIVRSDFELLVNIQHDIRSYSIAIIVRYLIAYYLDALEQFGDDGLDEFLDGEREKYDGFIDNKTRMDRATLMRNGISEEILRQLSLSSMRMLLLIGNNNKTENILLL